jgi:hypothetical protein
VAQRGDSPHGIDDWGILEVWLGLGRIVACTTAHPPHTGIANIFGTFVSEATMRPNPTAVGAAGGAGLPRVAWHQGPRARPVVPVGRASRSRRSCKVYASSIDPVS